MLSFSNFGSTKHPLVDKVIKATKIIKQRAPELLVDGEMGRYAVAPDVLGILSVQLGKWPTYLFFRPISANVSYKLLDDLAHSNGPILIGINRPSFTGPAVM